MLGTRWHGVEGCLAQEDAPVEMASYEPVCQLSSLDPSACPVTEPGLSLHHHQLHHHWADHGQQGGEWEGGQGRGQQVLGAQGGGVQDQGALKTARKES